MIKTETTKLPAANIAFSKAFGYARASEIYVTVTNASSGSGGWISGIMSLTAPAPVSVSECHLAYSATAFQNLIDTNISSWFDAALAELDGIKDEAQVEGFKPPSKRVREAAADLLVLLHSEFPALDEPSVYPSEDGDVEIAFGRRDAAATVLIIIERSGSAACYSHINGKNSRLRRDEWKDLPDAFLREQLSKLLYL